MPRAWLVGETRSVTSDDALQAIRGQKREEFDPWRVALVEAGSVRVPMLAGPLAVGSTVRIDAYRAGNVVLQTSSPRPAFLVLSESYFPGWQATVDGTPVPIYQTNYLLLGISVPAGQHRVEMTFHAQGAKHGSLVSLATLVFMGTLGLMYRRSQARKSAQRDAGALQ